MRSTMEAVRGNDGEAEELIGGRRDETYDGGSVSGDQFLPSVGTSPRDRYMVGKSLTLFTL
jgi:hypothetical protein